MQFFRISIDSESDFAMKLQSCNNLDNICLQGVNPKDIVNWTDSLARDAGILHLPDGSFLIALPSPTCVQRILIGKTVIKPFFDEEDDEEEEEESDPDAEEEGGDPDDEEFVRREHDQEEDQVIVNDLPKKPKADPKKLGKNNYVLRKNGKVDEFLACDNYEDPDAELYWSKNPYDRSVQRFDFDQCNKAIKDMMKVHGISCKRFMLTK